MAKPPWVVKLSGPFFEKKDPAKVYWGNVHRLLDDLAAIGEDETRKRLYPSKSAVSAGPKIKGRTSAVPWNRCWRVLRETSASRCGRNAAGSCRARCCSFPSTSTI